MNDVKLEHISKPFLQTLVDAVLYAKLASETKSNDHSKLIAKAAILHCSFTVEALANNILQFINIGTKLTESIERLDVIAKIELLALILNKKLDRGAKSIQTFSEFIKLRNSYVHPKIRTQELIEEEPGKLKKSQNKTLEQLKLKEDAQEWTSEDATRCIVKLIKAIDQFLLHEIGFEKCSLSCMFLDFLDLQGTRGPIVPSSVECEWVNWLTNDLNTPPRFYVDHILKRYEKV